MPNRLISLKEVLDRIPLSKATIYRRINAGTFPQPIRISAHRIAFSEQEINAWVERHVEARNNGDRHDDRPSPLKLGDLTRESREQLA